MALGYATHGSGPHKVIVLHGWFGDETFLRPAYDALDGAAFTYIVPAYRGYGASKDLRGDYTVEEIAADVIALADALGLETFSLVGHSMGGKFMQKVAAKAPARVNRMVGVAPVPAAAAPFDDQGWALFSSAAESLDSRRAILNFSTGSRLPAAWIDGMARHSAATSTREAFGAYLLAWAKSDFHEEVTGSRTPTKVVIGEHDPAIDEATMRATFLQWYKRAELEVIPNSGHYPMNETPLALGTAMESFLRG